jgi:hypothetical protein
MIFRRTGIYTMKKLILVAVFLLLALIVTSCQVIGDIFSAGVYTGIFVVIIVVVIIIWIFTKLRNR